MDMQVTTEELLEVVFSVSSVPTIMSSVVE
jgi:hypothetical protein